MNHQRQMSAQLIRDNSNDNRKSPMIAGEPLHDYKRAVGASLPRCSACDRLAMLT